MTLCPLDHGANAGDERCKTNSNNVMSWVINWHILYARQVVSAAAKGLPFETWIILISTLSWSMLSCHVINRQIGRLALYTWSITKAKTWSLVLVIVWILSLVSWTGSNQRPPWDQEMRGWTRIPHLRLWHCKIQGVIQDVKISMKIVDSTQGLDSN